MLKGLNEKLKISFQAKVMGNMDEVIDFLKQKAKDYKWHETFLKDSDVDFREFVFLEKGIEINREPKLVSPNRPSGKIRFILLEKSSTETEVDCEIIPWNNSLPFKLFITMLATFLWVTVFFVLSKNLEAGSIAMIIVLAIISVCIPLVKFWFDRNGLVQYANTIISLMRNASSLKSAINQ